MMEYMATGIMNAWTYAATEHVDLRCMYETGFPYMTVYIDGAREMFRPSDSAIFVFCWRRTSYITSVCVLTVC